MTNMLTIRKLQKKCIRIITLSDFNSHTNTVFTDLKILKVDIIKFNLLKFICEFNHELLPTDLSNIFLFNSDIHNYNTRSIVSQGPLIWNELSKNLPSINEVHSTNKFKNTIKKHFLSLYQSTYAQLVQYFISTFLLLLLLILYIFFL